MSVNKIEITDSEQLSQRYDVSVLWNCIAGRCKSHLNASLLYWKCPRWPGTAWHRSTRLAKDIAATAHACTVALLPTYTHSSLLALRLYQTICAACSLQILAMMASPLR
ncbi:hypothetical protein CBL_11537 [Carabus blaptoides fortunei]